MSKKDKEHNEALEGFKIYLIIIGLIVTVCIVGKLLGIPEFMGA